MRQAFRICSASPAQLSAPQAGDGQHRFCRHALQRFWTDPRDRPAFAGETLGVWRSATARRVLRALLRRGHAFGLGLRSTKPRGPSVAKRRRYSSDSVA